MVVVRDLRSAGRGLWSGSGRGSSRCICCILLVDVALVVGVVVVREDDLRMRCIFNLTRPHKFLLRW
jgi:hypothetical protein